MKAVVDWEVEPVEVGVGMAAAGLEEAAVGEAEEKATTGTEEGVKAAEARCRRRRHS